MHFLVKNRFWPDWLAGPAYIAAAIGSVASINAASFYAELVQPPWAPPAWLFGPMWTTLYGLMGIAAWLAWREPSARPALVVFAIQLALNALWSWLFFAWSWALSPLSAWPRFGY